MVVPAGQAAQTSGSFKGLYEGPGRIRGMGYGHRIIIDAPPEIVWAILADFAGWGRWNPLYSETVGVMSAGEPLRCLVNLEGMKPQKVGAKVYRVVPNEVIEYGAPSLGGLVNAFRYIEVEELTPTRCRVVNGEIMGGLVGQQVLARLVGPKISNGLKHMNAALKIVAETKWREQGA